MPHISFSGNIKPESTMSMFFPYSKTIIFFPTSPKPPKGIILSTFLLIHSYSNKKPAGNYRPSGYILSSYPVVTHNQLAYSSPNNGPHLDKPDNILAEVYHIAYSLSKISIT